MQILEYKINRYSLSKVFIAEGLLKITSEGPEITLVYKDLEVEVSVIHKPHPLIALSILREQLEERYSSLINCNGCKIDTAYRPTGGYGTYIISLEHSQPTTLEQRLNIFEPATEISKLCTVAEHKAAYKKWCDGLMNNNNDY